jgi:hypothetical protein
MIHFIIQMKKKRRILDKRKNEYTFINEHHHDHDQYDHSVAYDLK